MIPSARKSVGSNAAMDPCDYTQRPAISLHIPLYHSHDPPESLLTGLSQKELIT